MNRFFLLFSAILLSASVFGQVSKYSEVNVALNGRSLADIAALGIPAEEGILARNGGVTLILSQEELGRMARAGFTWDVITDDYSAYITERNAGMAGEIVSINS